MEDWALRMPWSASRSTDLVPLLTREWLVSNGLGGYASGTVSGAMTRRYHGLLIAALPNPFGRQVMLNHLSELIRLSDGHTELISGEDRAGDLRLYGSGCLAEFRLEMGLPVWRYQIGNCVVEKRVLLVHRQNTAFIQYRLVSGDDKVRLKLRPSVDFRSHESRVDQGHHGPYTLTAVADRYELASHGPLPPLRMFVYGEEPAFTVHNKKLDNLYYREEADRGYDSVGTLYSPGYFRVDLARDHDVTLVASTEPWENIMALSPKLAFEAERERCERLMHTARPEVKQGPARELVLAADQFIIMPSGRIEDAARARAAGDEVRTVIAGYHWFTDWGRDTMISLEGLTLTTGRQVEAGYILRTFGYYVRDGLIPNLFPEGEREGLYHTADATLWFFHAIDRYLHASNDRQTLRILLPKLEDIVAHHIRGTHFGIHVDPADDLLSQGAEGYQLTWMDAKVGDWVVTPRRGKAVEINALWYNALRLLERWLKEERGADAARPIGERADRVRASFNRRFWYEAGGYLYDVIDGPDGNDLSFRPNQVFAIGLPNEVLASERWQTILDQVRERLLTPVGLRSLAPGSPDYKAKYFGDLRSRDAAYHQGTVWGWLIGPFIDAWLKAHPDDKATARKFLEGYVDHLREACLGSVSEIFDAEKPYTPRGCIAQAWSVAEVLRCWARTAT
jgi:predicted glycogen debranching enzyme